MRRPITAKIFQPGPQLARMLTRECAVIHYRDLVAVGIKKEIALERTAEAFSFSVSSRSIARWDFQYCRLGILGLAERKIGRVGRKPGRVQR